MKVFESLKSPLRFVLKIAFTKRVVYGVKSMFYKGKIPLFRKSVFFSPRFYRKCVFLISLGIICLPIYYIMCIEPKEAEGEVLL